jgi:hypothetical protein
MRPPRLVAPIGLAVALDRPRDGVRARADRGSHRFDGAAPAGELSVVMSYTRRCGWGAESGLVTDVAYAAIARAGRTAVRSTPWTKSRNSSAKRAGSWRCGKCPASGKVARRLPGMSSCGWRACRTGMIGSRLPQRNRVGICVAVRGRFIADTRSPAAAMTARSVASNAARASAVASEPYTRRTSSTSPSVCSARASAPMVRRT